jgi:hypothetical protein
MNSRPLAFQFKYINVADEMRKENRKYIHRRETRTSDHHHKNLWYE